MSGGYGGYGISSMGAGGYGSNGGGGYDISPPGESYGAYGPGNGRQYEARRYGRFAPVPVDGPSVASSRSAEAKWSGRVPQSQMAGPFRKRVSE